MNSVKFRTLADNEKIKNSSGIRRNSQHLRYGNFEQIAKLKNTHFNNSDRKHFDFGSQQKQAKSNN